MTDSYIKQVAETVRDAVANALYADSVDLDAIIASVPKPEPVAWMDVANHHEGPYNFHGQALLDKGRYSLYAYPPDAQAEIAHLKATIADRDKRLSVAKHQVKGADNLFNEARAEIDRINAKATEREGFIEQLMAQRHAELIEAVNLGWDAGGEDWNSEHCHLPDDAKAEREAIVAGIEKGE